MTRREQHGAYTAIEGKLAIDDARAAYVTGPTKDGTFAPIASFWQYEEAVAYAKESARPLAYKDRVYATIVEEGPFGPRPYRQPRRVYGTVRELRSHVAIVLWDEPNDLPSPISLGDITRVRDCDLDLHPTPENES